MHVADSTVRYATQSCLNRGETHDRVKLVLALESLCTAGQLKMEKCQIYLKTTMNIYLGKN